MAQTIQNSRITVPTTKPGPAQQQPEPLPAGLALLGPAVDRRGAGVDLGAELVETRPRRRASSTNAAAEAASGGGTVERHDAITAIRARGFIQAIVRSAASVHSM